MKHRVKLRTTVTCYNDVQKKRVPSGGGFIWPRRPERFGPILTSSCRSLWRKSPGGSKNMIAKGLRQLLR